MEMRVLGPVQLLSAGDPLPLAPKLRAVMALLAVHANTTVSIDLLVDGLWGEDPPPSAAKTLQTYVFLIRRHLASAGDGLDAGVRLVTAGQGYRLDVAADALDARRFEDLQQRARTVLESDPRVAADGLTAALALWHGPPYADFAYEGWAEAEIDRLEELRASAFEQLAQARMALGEHEQIVSDLRRAVAELPFREQLWASLMLALYRSGRRAEALLAFRDAEKALRKELAAEPGPELQDLAGRIRNSDPSLSGARAVTASSGSPTATALTPLPRASAAVDSLRISASGARRGAVNRRSIAVVGVLAAVVVFVAGLVRFTGDPGVPQPTLTAAQRDLKSRLPLTIRDACVPDLGEQPPLGLSAGFRCVLQRGSPANYVQYWQFTTADRFDVAIESLIQQQDLLNGDCAREPRAVGNWDVGRLHAGRMLCYPESGGRWVVWTYTEDRIVGRAFRNDDDWKALIVWARQLAMFLRA